MPIPDDSLTVDPLPVDPLALSLRAGEREWLASRRAQFDCTAVRAHVLASYGLLEEN